MAERAVVGYHRIDQLEMKKRMQYVLNLEISGLEKAEIAKTVMAEYGYNSPQAYRLIQKAHNNVKELLEKNAERLSTTVLAKLLHALRTAEDKGDIRLQLEILRDIRQMCNLDKKLPKIDTKPSKIKGLSEL